MDLQNICLSGDLPKLKLFCEKLKREQNSKVKLNTTLSGMFLLDMTVIYDKFDCFKYLIETFQLNPLQLNQHGESSFSYSLQLSRANILKYLIENRSVFLPMRNNEYLLTKAACNSTGLCAFQIVIETDHQDAEKILALMLEYVKMSSSLRKSLFTGAVKMSNTSLIDSILGYGELKMEDRRELINLNFNPSLNYMKSPLISEATTTPLIYAISKKDRQLVNFFLSDPDVDVNMLNIPLKDKSALHLSIEQNDLETVTLLIDKGVNRTKCLKGALPLELAIKSRVQYLSIADQKQARENFLIIELLSSGGMNDVHCLNDNGECPFDYAVQLQLTNVIEHFMSLQSDLFLRKNRLGKAPIDYSETEYANFLKKKF